MDRQDHYDSRTQELPTVVRTVLFASSGVVVACALQPLDVVKIRLQTGMFCYRGAMHCAHLIARHEGLRGLYAGTSAAVLRHAIHAAAWVTAHSLFISHLTKERPIGVAQRLLDGRETLANMLGLNLQVYWPSTLYEEGMIKAFCHGVLIGAVAAVVSNPAEVAMVRMVTDGLLRQPKQKQYRHVLHALVHIGREEGAKSLWSGSFHSMIRTLLNLGVTVPIYGTIRHSLINSGMPPDSASLYFFCNAAAGLVSSIVTLPSDFAKTRIQCSDTRCHVESAVRLLRAMTFKEAFRAVYSGLPPYAEKTLLQSALAALCYDHMADVYRWMQRIRAPPASESLEPRRAPPASESLEPRRAPPASES